MTKAPRLPRVFLIRHGETEWSISGQHTGVSDIPLTKNGEDVVVRLGQEIVGQNKLLCPTSLSHIFISPRHRAQKTYKLLFQSLAKDVPQQVIETTELVREWDYGEYEGKTTDEIRSAGKDDWDIFRDGCPGGDSPESMTKRVDEVISRVQQIHAEYWKRIGGEHGKSVADGERGGDVLIVSHGHFTKSFLARWTQLGIQAGRALVVDAGAVSVGGYQHRSLSEPSFLGLNMYSLGR